MPNEHLRSLVKTLYKSRDGAPLLLSDGQLQIYEAIVTRSHPFWHVMTHTQYGKSETAGIAALTVASNYPEKFAIIAGKKDTAQIIMDYAISHIFDNELTRPRFIVGEGETLDYIRRHRNKQHLSFDVGDGQLGELFIGSAKDVPVMSYGLLQFNGTATWQQFSPLANVTGSSMMPTGPSPSLTG